MQSNGSSKSKYGILALCLVGLCLSTTQADDNDPEKSLDCLFRIYCEDAGSASYWCDTQSEPDPTRMWTILSLYCGLGHGIPSLSLCREVARSRTIIERPVLAYDHRKGKWRPYSGLEGSLRKDGRLEQDINGIPKIYLSKKHELSVLVENTNPLLYTVNRGEAKEEDITDLKDLNTLAGGLGAILQSFAKIQGFVEDDDPRQRFLKALSQAKTQVEELSAARSSAIQTTQMVESRGTAAAPSTDSAKCMLAYPTSESIQMAFDNLRRTYDEVKGDTCPFAFEFYRAYIAILDANATKPTTVKKAVFTFNEVVAVAASIEACGTLADAGTLVASAKRIETAAPKKLKDILQTERTEYRARIGIRAKFEELLTTLLKQAKSILDESWKPVVVGANLDRFVDTCRRSLIGGFIGPWIFVETNRYPVKWNKLQHHPLKIVVKSPYAKEVSAARPVGVSPSYRVAWWRGSLLDVGVALTYTPLSSPKFSAVTDPSNSSQLVIAQTDEETRAGEVALFLSYRFLQHLRPSTRHASIKPGFDIGATISDDPGFFLGPSVEIGKLLRIGAGYTSQQVKELRGQIEGVTVIGSDNEIRTRDTFKSDYYVSLTFSLGTLKWFSK